MRSMLLQAQILTIALASPSGSATGVDETFAGRNFARGRRRSFSRELKGVRRPAKIIDLALYNHEHDTVPIRVAELGDVVDAMVFVQTAFTFSSGAPKETLLFPELPPVEADSSASPAPSPELSAAYTAARVAKVHRVVLNATPSACWTSPKFQGNFYPPLKSAAHSRKLPWCIQSAVRNMLGALFVRAGGTDHDWALISDADEIARASLVKSLRQLDAQSHKSVLVLNSIHHYKYTLRCAEEGTITRGPVAISGRLLRDLGAQRARDGGRRSCIPVGHHGSCGRVNRRPSDAASWQFSNFGGIESFRYKLRTNSFAASAKLLDTSLVRERERGCRDHLDRGQAFNFNFTGYDVGTLPRAPEVPEYLENELAHGRFRHFLDMFSPTPRASLVEPARDPRLWLVLPTES